MHSNILVFKTSIDEKDMSHIKALMNRIISMNDTWNVDLEDCDNILRVESISIQPVAIIGILKQAGFACEELED